MVLQHKTAKILDFDEPQKLHPSKFVHIRYIIVDCYIRERKVAIYSVYNAPIKVLPIPMQANKGPDQGIRLKLYPQGRGILFAIIKLLYKLAI